VLTASVGESVSGVVLSGPLLLAALLAVAAGALSFFSPCCLPLVPGYLSYIAGVTGADTQAGAELRQRIPATAGASLGAGAGAGGQVPSKAVTGAGGQVPTKAVTGAGARHRTVLGSVLFVLGFAAVFTSYGALFGAFGGLLIVHQETLVRVLGVLTIGLGLVFTGLLWRIPLAGRTFRIRYRPRAGLAGAPVVGVLFGLGWTPCIGPTLAAVLTLATSSADAGRGAALSFAYSLGLGVPFVLAAASVQRVMRSFGWARRHARGIMRAGGAMLVLLGVLQVSGLWTALVTRLQGVIVGWQVPL
jgi:cytochrome c-type biogenesis protein